MRDQLSNYIKLGLLLSMLMIYFLPGYVVNSGVDSELTNNIENFLGESALHRIDIWQRNIELIKKRPLTGWGTSDGNELPKTEKASFFNKLIKRDEFRHPHNMFLQITLELGLLGLLLFIFLLNYLLNKISNLNPSFRPYLYASFISFSCVWLVSGTVWRSWWLVYLSMFVFAVVLINNSFEYEDEPLS